MLQQLDYWNQIIIFAVFAISLNLVQGYAGQTTIAQAAFGAMGGYGAALLSVKAGAPFIVGALFGIAAGYVVGTVLSIPALGVGTNYLILLTLAFAYVVNDLLVSLQFFGGDSGVLNVSKITFFGLHIISQYQIFAFFGVIGLLVLGFSWRVGESGYGRILKGLREDEAATRSLGKNTVKYQASVFGVCSGMAGLAGAMFAFYFGSANVADFSLNEAILMIIMVVIGGSGNLLGSVVGAGLIVASTPALEDWIHISPQIATYWQQVVYGAALVLVMLFWPAGILREHVSGRARIWTRAANMVRGRVPVATVAPDPTDLTGPTPVLGGPVPISAMAGGGSVLVSESAGGQSVSAFVGSGGGGGVATMPIDRDRVRDIQLLRPKVHDGNGAVPAGTPVLEVTDLWKRFGGITAVAGVNLELPAQEVTALIGPNGAGKSTMFGLFTGFMAADKGSIKLRGREVRNMTPNAIAGLGMVRSFQDVRLFRYMTSLQNVMLAIPNQPFDSMIKLFSSPRSVHRAEKATRERAMELLEWVGMEKKWNVLTGDLSHGEQKLVAIARVLGTGADVLLLDEPTSGVDPEWVEAVAQVINELPKSGHTVCVVEHNLGFLQMLNASCYFMELGRIRTRGTLDDLMADDELRSVYFGL